MGRRMERRELFEKIADRLRDTGSLARAMSVSGFDKKDVNAVRFMISASEEDFKAAAYSEDASESTKAVTKLSEETSIDRAAIASLILEIRSTLGLVRPEAHVSELMEVKNAGNNLMLGPGGFLFRPDPNRARSLFLYRYMGEGREAEVPEAVQMGGLRYEVDSIGDSAFKEAKIESVALHDGIRTIGATAFRDCSDLKSIMIPRTVLEIGVGAFRGCSSLPSIEVEEGSRGYRSVGGIVYDSGLTDLLHAPGGLGGDVKIPEGTERIGPFAFYGCGKIASVRLPDTLKAIGDSAFNGCSGLSAMRMPASLDSIGGYAFSGCSGIREFSVEDGADRRGIFGIAQIHEHGTNLVHVGPVVGEQGADVVEDAQGLCLDVAREEDFALVVDAGGAADKGVAEPAVVEPDAAFERDAIFHGRIQIARRLKVMQRCRVDVGDGQRVHHNQNARIAVRAFDAGAGDEMGVGRQAHPFETTLPPFHHAGIVVVDVAHENPGPDAVPGYLHAGFRKTGFILCEDAFHLSLGIE